MSKPAVREALIQDPVVVSAMQHHCDIHGTSDAEAQALVEEYVDEIVPFFDVLSYYKIGYNLAHLLTRLLYRVSSEYQDRDALNAIPRKDVVLYLMNHRSNADYVIVAYVLAHGVSISYAVGEWARIWPLEYVFKSFGAYFVRRGFREALYHTVLERYVQLITRNGVTQGIFMEGGLTRNGELQPAKVGLLDYIARTTLDPAFDRDIWLVPVAINYDRVLEDRTLIRELLDERDRPSKPRQLLALTHYLLFNTLRLLTGRLKRYGRAVVNFGPPLSLRQWSDRHDGSLRLPRQERLPKLQHLADEVMQRVAAIMPVTPVPLVAAAFLSFEETVVPTSDLVERLDEYRDHLLASGAKLVRGELDACAILDRGWRMLKLRRLVVREAGNYIILPAQRPLLEYYANSVAHLLPDAPLRRPMHPAHDPDGSLPRLRS
ncbi:MAG: 1-acyl-sn-glycerol-3-phosphate acyltransferase [Gemmatimonadota bacterium]|nr:MAG: 1-acyl-sn-glycerol-3-phosphate acyltransferase [Gemmatimonadota bacterium]